MKSVTEECLSKRILVGEASLRRALRQSLVHAHGARNHQGNSNVVLLPEPIDTAPLKPVRCRERLGARVSGRPESDRSRR
ncbi:MAG: hypothetical protein ABIU05_15100 [Nitrospirales bacterium]